MARIRNIKPGFFRDETLQDLQTEHPELHPMLVFAGLWTVADKNGVFEWLPRTLKLDILPFLSYDLVASLALLERFSLISQFSRDGRGYGFVANFSEHQRISGKELATPSKYPVPPEKGSTREATEKQPDAQEGDGVQGEEGSAQTSPELHPLNHARRMVEVLGISERILRSVEAGLVAEQKLTGNELAETAQYIVSRAMEDRTKGIAIDRFYFDDTKWRNGNGSKRQVSPAVERDSQIIDSLSAAARNHIAKRNAPDSVKREDGPERGSQRRISAGAV